MTCVSTILICSFSLVLSLITSEFSELCVDVGSVQSVVQYIAYILYILSSPEYSMEVHISVLLYILNLQILNYLL